MSPLDRVLLLAASLLAAYQVAVGIEGHAPLPMLSFTVGFGMLLVIGILLIILGFELLDNAWVILVSTGILLSLSLGTVSHYLPELVLPYLAFAILGSLVLVGGVASAPIGAACWLAVPFQLISAIALIGVPIWLVATRRVGAGFLVAGLGGLLVIAGGILLVLQEGGKPAIAKERFRAMIPGLLFLITTAFVAGFGLE